MVDSVRNSASVNQGPSVSKQSNSNSLRETFRNLSSGLSVSQTLRDAPAVVSVQASRSGQLGKMLNGLQEAVKSSKETLRALEKVAQEAPKDGEPDAVKAFAEDVDRLKSDIESMLSRLNERAGRAEVLSENLTAADARLEDLDRAREKAEALNADRLADAHSGLTPERVQELLAD